MSDHNEPLAILRYSKIDAVEEPIFDDVVHALQPRDHLVKIVLVPIEKSTDVLEYPNIRVRLLYGIYEDGEPVSRVLEAELLSADTEGLTRRAADHDGNSRILLLDVEFYTLTMP